MRKNLTAAFLMLGLAGCGDEPVDMNQVVEAQPIIEPVYGNQDEINKECSFVLGMSRQFQDRVNYTDAMEDARGYFINQVNFAGVTGQQVVADYLPRYSQNNDVQKLDFDRIEQQAVKCAYSPMLQR